MTIRSSFRGSFLRVAAGALVSSCSHGADQRLTAAGADSLYRQRIHSGEVAQAYQGLLDASSRQPNDQEIRLDLATIYLIAANKDQARDDVLAVLDKDPANLRAIRLYAASAVSPSDQAAAAKMLEASQNKTSADTVARLVPSSTEARVARALDDVAAGRRDDAKRLLREAIQSDPTNAAAARMLAFILLADGNADDALSVLTPVLSKDVGDLDALMLRGEARLVKKQSAEALADFQSLTARDGSFSLTHYNAAVAYLQQANAARAAPQRDSALAGANRELRLAVKLTSNYPEAVLQLAALRIQAGSPNDAIRDLERFIDANPRSIRARTILGSALMAAQRLPEADETFHEIIRISPSNAEAHFWIGTMLARAGRRPEALAQFDTAATLSPTFVDAINQLASMMIADRKADAAAARVKRQIDMAPQSAPLYVVLGAVNAARSDTAGAEAAFQKANRIDARLIDPYLRLAELYAVTGKYDAALTHALDALAIDPNNTRAMLVAGTAYQQRGDVGKARAQYENLLKVNPRDGGAANNLAVLLSEQGDLDGGLKYATLAQQLSPADPHIADTLGWILYRRRSFDEAAKFIRGSAAQLPDSPMVNFHLGMVSQQIGDLGTARQALTKAVSSPTNFVGKDEARKALAQLK
jgi:tetratricopeptide (TPR) repeat protein